MGGIFSIFFRVFFFFFFFCAFLFVVTRTKTQRVASVDRTKTVAAGRLIRHLWQIFHVNAASAAIVRALCKPLFVFPFVCLGRAAVVTPC